MSQLSSEEQERLTQRIYDCYGQDFRHYNHSFVGRRILASMGQQQKNFDDYLDAVATEPVVFAELMTNLSINVTSMFRDPLVYKYLREKVLPTLATYPTIRIWSAGMSTGAEPWSLAIMLEEAGLLKRSLIYATDFNPAVLEQAKMGQVPLPQMANYTRNYINSGGTSAFSRYYSASHKVATLNASLAENIVFSTHNLAFDGMFNEFNLILCRNVLIYFDNTLTDRAFNLFNNSLAHRGYLTLGTQESMQFHSSSRYFESIHDQHKIYRKL